MMDDSTSRLCSACGHRLPPGLPEIMCPQCVLSGALEDEADRAAGDRGVMGEWQLLEELGRGGMGVVYRARSIEGGPDVALKTISAGELATPEMHRRFRVEARAASALRHSNLVAILDTGEQDGVPFLVMTLIEGRTLAARLAEGAMPPREAATLMRSVADAVSCIHAAGILHRDLKPSNVLLDGAGKPYVSDFGLAKQMHGNTVSEFTRTGQVLGSPAYMPPEQARGDNDRIGPASDVYALGAILYHLLTGRAPFAGASMHELLQKVEMSEPLPARRVLPAIPRDLETICIHCMEKSTAARCSSARALADDLTRWMEGQPVTARRPGWLQRRWRWCRRRPLIAGFAVLTLMLVAALGTSIILSNLSAAQRQEKEQSTERTAALDAVRAAVTGAEPAARSRGLAAMQQAAALGAGDELQDTAIALLSKCSYEPLSSVPLPSEARAVAFSPDLMHAVYALRGVIHVVRTADGSDVLTFDEAASRKPEDGAPEMIEFSSGGGLIAVQSAQGLLRLWRFTGFTADKKATAGSTAPGVKPAGEWRTMASVKNGFHPVCVPGDNALALRMAPSAGYPGGALILLHLDADTERTIVEHPGPEDFFTVNPVKETCAVYHDGTLTIRNLGFLDVIATIECPSRITRCEWQGNGERILAGCANGNVMLYSMFNGFTIPLNCLRHNAPVCRAGFAGPELTIVSASDEGFTRVFTAVTNQVHLEMRGVTGHRFNRNGTRLAAVDGSLRMLLWDKQSSVGVTKIAGVVSSRFESWEIDYAKKSRFLLMDSVPNLMVKDAQDRIIGGTALDGRKRGASFTPDESSLVIMDENGFSTLNLLSLSALGLPGPLSIVAPVACDPAWMPRRFCFARNGTLALEATDNRYGTAHWPDLTSVRELKGPRASSLDGPGGSPGGSGTLAVSPEGAWIAGGFPESGPAVIWNALTGDIVKELPHQGSVHFSPDGHWFLLGGESQWRLYTTGSWKEQWSQPRHGFARQLAVSAFAEDGRSLVMDTDTFQLTLLETESGKPLANFPLPEPISSTSVRYDSTRGTIYAGSRSNNIYRWDLPLLRSALKNLKIEPRF